MAWRTSYSLRDGSSSRDSKYLSSSLPRAYGCSRWSSSPTSTEGTKTLSKPSNSTEESSPVWTKASIYHNPSSVVQRLKERYNDTSKTDLGSAKRPDPKELTLNLSTRPAYHRGYTSLNLKEESLKSESKTKSKEDTKKEANDYKTSTELRSPYSYVRSDTNGTSSSSVFTSRASLRRKTPEPERSSLYEYKTRKQDYSPIESRPKIYQSSPLGSSPSTSRYLGTKRFSNSSLSSSTPATPTTPTTEYTKFTEPFGSKAQQQEETQNDDETISVVTRGTSPTQPSTSIYVRTRRADSARTIEKTIKKPKIRASTKDAEVQVDDLGTGSAIKHIVSDPTSRLKPWSSYLDKYSSSSTVPSTSKFSSGRTSYVPKYEPTDYRRSISRETPQREMSLTAKSKLEETTHITPQLNGISDFKKNGDIGPETKLKSTLSVSISPRGLSPVDSDAKSTENKTGRSRSRTQDSDTGKSISELSEDKSTSNLRSKISKSSSISGSKKQCPPNKISVASKTASSNKVSNKTSSSTANLKSSSMSQKVESSASESTSSEDESTSTDTDSLDDDFEYKSSQMSSAKRSISNFLQNSLSKADCLSNRSRPSIFASGSVPKIKFKPIESGERAWWLNSNDNVPEGVTALNSSTSNQKSNHLEPPTQLINRQYSRDKDWLKSSSEDISTRSGKSESSPNEQGKIIFDESVAASKFKAIRNFDDEKPWWMKEESDESKRSSPNKICATPEERSRSSRSPENHRLVNGYADYGKDAIDVTPALRRRREQHNGNAYSISDIQIKINSESDKKEDLSSEPKPGFLDECKIECSVKDIARNLVNGLTSILEEKKVTAEEGDMSGMISRAKEDLIKSQTREDSRKNLEEKRIKSKEVERAEIDMYWKELIDSLDRPLRLCDLDFTDLNSEDENELFVNKSVASNGPPPMPPLPTGLPPAPPPSFGSAMIINSKAPAPPPPPALKNTKTVKLFWKEVPFDVIPTGLKEPMVWDEIKPVTLDTFKLEQLFESRAKDLTKKQQDQNKTKAVIVLDHKRSNAINIGMTKLPPPRAIKTAILKMDSTVVNKEGIEKLLIMLPTEEEIARIQEAQASCPELPLGTAEQFLLTLSTISELEARLKLWAFKMDFENSEKEICEPLYDLKQGIEILRNNRTFHSILSTLLSIGNFLNGNSAKGFQIDYLTKVPEVKDTVNKHSLLHHLCVIVMEKFHDSTDLYSEIGPVTRASRTDFDELAANIKKVEDECKCSWNHLKVIAQHEGQTQMKMKMSDFLADCAERIIVIGIVHRRILCRFRKFLLWLGIPWNKISTMTPHEIFKIIAEFALEYRTTRERILQQAKKASHRDKSRNRLVAESKKMNSKEAREEAELRKVLNGDEPSKKCSSSWRRSRPLSNDKINDDNEILETLIKTANQAPNNTKERRKSRVYGKN